MAQRPTLSTPVIIVLFGATGDLAKRMVLPAFYTLAEQQLMPQDYLLAHQEYSPTTPIPTLGPAIVPVSVTSDGVR